MIIFGVVDKFYNWYFDRLNIFMRDNEGRDSSVLKVLVRGQKIYICVMGA